MASVSETKKKVVKEFVELLDKYPVVAVANMANLPTKTVQKMRVMLRGKGTVLRMTKKRLMKLAFAQAKKEGIAELEKHFKGMPALIFTNDNPFTLYAQLEKNKSSAPAKPGQEAPKDIIVKTGPTSFSPGPIIGQLGKFGIKAGVENGKIVIKADSVVAKAGDVIDEELAGILTRLGVEPMEIGLDLRAAYEKGSIFTSDVLYIDENEYMDKFKTAYTESLNLSVNSGYPTTESIKLLISKAASESRAVSLESNFITSDTAKDIIRKAEAQASSLSSKIPGSPEVKVKEAAVEATSEPAEKPPEEKKEPKEEQGSALGSLFG